MYNAPVSDLPAAVLDIIDTAPRYPEGRGVQFEIKNAEDLRNIEKVAIIKMANYARNAI